MLEELERALKEAGFRFRTGDENIELHYRNCDEKEANCRAIMADFLEMKVDLIYSLGSPVISTVKKMLVGTEVPVVCAEVFDPVVMGLLRDYEGTHGNVTGTYYRVSLAEQLDKGLIPLVDTVKRLGVIYNTGELHSEIQLDEAKKLASERGFELFPFDVQNPGDLHRALEFFQDQEIDALFLPADTMTPQVAKKDIKALAEKFPALCALRSAVQKGGLVSYCANWRNLCQVSAKSAVRILNGESPDKIPFVGPQEHQLIVNLETARALGLSVGEETRKKAAELIEKS
ncbi:MAG: ABC transporter substrate-binding protein [Candidatus Eremiobacteraeota bacterium]|nr:ABC transporter substrate-binding protein [Candidatus Eremiobacteraeota bacterium]